jgi:hypothetical protein
MLWMVLPHIAIMSNLLLAGNSPDIWEGLIDLSGASSAQTLSNRTYSFIIVSIHDQSGIAKEANRIYILTTLTRGIL